MNKSSQVRDEKIFITFGIGGTPFRMKLEVDSGAGMSAIPLSVHCKNLADYKMSPPDVILKSYFHHSQFSETNWKNFCSSRIPGRNSSG